MGYQLKETALVDGERACHCHGPQLSSSYMSASEIALLNALVMLEEGLAPNEKPFYETLAEAGLANADTPRLTRAGRDLLDALKLRTTPYRPRRL